MILNKKKVGSIKSIYLVQNFTQIHNFLLTKLSHIFRIKGYFILHKCIFFYIFIDILKYPMHSSKSNKYHSSWYHHKHETKIYIIFIQQNGNSQLLFIHIDSHFHHYIKSNSYLHVKEMQYIICKQCRIALA